MALASDVPPGGGASDCRLWGKKKGLSRAYPVVCHLLDTAAVFLVLWDELLGAPMRGRLAGVLGLDVAEARAVGVFWAGPHDLGKITPPFQAQVPGEFVRIKGEPEYPFVPGADELRAFRREMGTHWALAGLSGEVGYPGSRKSPRRAVSHQVAQMLGGHHGWYGAALKSKELAAASAYQPGLGGAGWEERRRRHFVRLRRITGAAAVPESGLPAELAVLVTGLVLVSDWLAGQTHVIEPRLPAPGRRGTPAELDAHWEGASKAAGQLVAEARLGRTRFETVGFGSMFPFTPNPLQADLAEQRSTCRLWSPSTVPGSFS
jgi:CRISPR-associated endonuclease/helicase Cas3